MQSRYASQLQTIFELQPKIQDIHPFLDQLYPVAIAEGDQFTIYTPDPASRAYQFTKQAAAPMPVPQGVRAAFPLDCLDNQMACVVTGDVFNSLDGYITIYHEFMHCRQFECCEQQLKSGLDIARKAEAAGDFLWEINHPFPYISSEFTRLYGLFFERLCEKNLAAVLDARRELKSVLNEDDYQYMLWQEWKEGFARYIENQVRCRLGSPENTNGQDQPFARVSFYAGGAGWIGLIKIHQPGLLLELDSLFQKMLLA